MEWAVFLSPEVNLLSDGINTGHAQRAHIYRCANSSVSANSGRRRPNDKGHHLRDRRAAGVWPRIRKTNIGHQMKTLLTLAAILAAFVAPHANAETQCRSGYSGVGGPAYMGVGGPCYTGVGGGGYNGIGGPAYAGIGGSCYRGVGGPAYDGVGGPAYDGVGGPCYRGVGGRAYDGVGGGPGPFICMCRIIKMHSGG